MKKIFAAIMGMLFLNLQPAIAQVPGYEFIQVTGNAETKVKAEYALVQLTVFSRAATAQAAQKTNAKEMARVDKILKSDFKIEAKDIQTSSFQVNPEYNYTNNRQVFSGMSVSHMLTVKFRQIGEVGDLLDKLMSGVSKEDFGVRIGGISFGTDQMRQYEAQALEQAIADAKARAQVLAKSSGKTLKEARKISDLQVQGGSPQPMYRMEMASMAAMDKSAGTQIEAGELTVRAQIQVEYEMK